MKQPDTLVAGAELFCERNDIHLNINRGLGHRQSRKIPAEFFFHVRSAFLWVLED